MEVHFLRRSAEAIQQKMNDSNPYHQHTEVLIFLENRGFFFYTFEIFVQRNFEDPFIFLTITEKREVWSASKRVHASLICCIITQLLHNCRAVRPSSGLPLRHFLSSHGRRRSSSPDGPRGLPCSAKSLDQCFLLPPWSDT